MAVMVTHFRSGHPAQAKRSQEVGQGGATKGVVVGSLRINCIVNHPCYARTQHSLPFFPPSSLCSKVYVAVMVTHFRSGHPFHPTLTIVVSTSWESKKYQIEAGILHLWKCLTFASKMGKIRRPIKTFAFACSPIWLIYVEAATSWSISP